jgi:tetratricopeptide (TPR) repeat protein
MKRIWLFLVLIVAVLAGGCVKQVARCTAPEDNPAHHYLRGMEALESGRIDLAQEKFDRALYCEENFSAAYGGKAIVAALKAKGTADAGYRTIEVARAEEYLEKAKKLIETDNDRFEYQLAVLRVVPAVKGKDWLDRAEVAYRAAQSIEKIDERRLDYYQGKEAAAYFMGLAYLEGYQFRKAEDKFRETLDSRKMGKWNEPADKAWKKTSKIVRAMGGITVGDVGKKIAVKDTVSRGDLTALLVDEMKIDKLFAGRIPVKSQLDAMKAEFTPADLLSHPFRDEVNTIMKWKVRGLEPKFDQTTKAYLFKPEDKVLRGEMAFILEDVLMKLTGDEKIATAYFGQERSPFPDVKTTSPYYNAVMNMTSRGIMEGELSGEFRFNEPVDGAEAILAIRMLQQKINIY